MTNVAEIELSINGQTQGRKIVENGIAEWKIAFTNGINTVKAIATKNSKSYTDTKAIEFQLQSCGRLHIRFQFLFYRALFQAAVVERFAQALTAIEPRLL